VHDEHAEDKIVVGSTHTENDAIDGFTQYGYGLIKM